MMKTMTERVTLSQEKVLLNLAKFKYLTVSQLVSIGIMSGRSNMSKQVKRLRDAGFVKSTNYSPGPRYGRVENMTYLSAKGKNLLVDEMGVEASEIRWHTGRVAPLFRDYYHRKSTIDFHIHLNDWVAKQGHSLLFFDTYFDKTGNNRNGQQLRAKTRVSLQQGYMIPDGAFAIETIGLGQELMILEIKCSSSPLETLGQIKKHTQAIELGSINEKYSYDKPYHVLFVIEVPSLMASVVERMKSDPYFTYVRSHFLFKTMEQVKSEDLTDGWINGNGEKQNLL